MTPAPAAPLVRRLGTLDRAPLRALLMQAPGAFAFALGWLDECGVSSADPGSRFEFVGAFVNSRLVGAALVVGRSLALLATHDVNTAAAIGAFCARASIAARIWTGHPSALDSLLGVARLGGGIVRDEPQRVLTVAGVVSPLLNDPTLVVASTSDLDDLIAASCAMHHEELGVAPSRADVAMLSRSIARRVQQRRAFISRDPVSQRLRFKAALTAVSADACQVEGVWVDPEQRGRGVARNALASVCRLALSESRRVALYVATSNAPARACYARIGFVDEGPWRSVVFNATGQRSADETKSM